jgi:hypothetical protein
VAVSDRVLKNRVLKQWDRIGAWILALAGVIVIGIGWKETAGTPFPAEQLPYLISAGIGGALLVGFGAALLITAELRDEWHKLDRIEQAIRETRGDPWGNNGLARVEPPVSPPSLDLEDAEIAAVRVEETPAAGIQSRSARERPLRARS